jgi:phage gp46-like protein
MSDVRLTWGGQAADLSIVENDLETDGGLETAVILSLFTNRRADDTDVLPDEAAVDRQGWWGDASPAPTTDRIGSRLWLLGREKQRAVILERAQSYAIESLQWLLTDRIASSVDVTAEITRPGWLGLQINIDRPVGQPAVFRYDYTWQAQAVRMGAQAAALLALPVSEDGTVSLVLNQLLQNTASALGDGTKYDVLAASHDLTFYIIGNGAVSAGAVTLKESHDATYAGDWPAIGPAIDVPANGVKVVRVARGTYRAVKAEITSVIVGGSVTVIVMGS